MRGLKQLAAVAGAVCSNVCVLLDINRALTNLHYKPLCNETCDNCKQGELSAPEQQEAEGKEGRVQHSARGELSSRSLEHDGDGDGEEGGEQEEDEEKEEPSSALEKILPRFPASRKEVFVKLEAVSGLLPPFTARGSAVSARVFWAGEEVRSAVDA